MEGGNKQKVNLQNEKEKIMNQIRKNMIQKELMKKRIHQNKQEQKKIQDLWI